MNLRVLGEAIDLTVDDAPGATVDLSTTPFARGFDAVGVISQLGNDSAGVISIETSDTDVDADFVAVLTLTGQVPTVMGEVVLKRYARANCTVASATGTANAYLIV
jgi:hypothetical protein